MVDCLSQISIKIPGAMKLSTLLPITIGSDRIMDRGGSGGLPRLLLTPPPYEERPGMRSYTILYAAVSLVYPHSQ